MTRAHLESAHRDEHRFYALLSLGGLVTLAGLAAAHWMEVEGHIVTGMNNQVVWGLPHVFAIFMIVAGSGVLNVASIGSVFGVAAYKQRAPLSALLSLALLAGGLMVLMLDLGRPERLIVAATHYNFSSVFAWNVFLYSGMFAIVAIYLWTIFERRFNGYTQAAGIAAYEVLDHRGVLTDPQLRDRQVYDVAPSVRFGRDLFTGHPIRMSDTPASVPWAGPNMGQHTREVLAEAGWSAARIEALLVSGVGRQP